MKFTIFPVKIGKKTSSRYGIIGLAQLCIKKALGENPVLLIANFTFR